MAARRSYTAAFKLRVVACAKEMGNRTASHHFCVNEKQIRYWKKQEDLLMKCRKSKKANRGGSARWALLEEVLAAWVLEQIAITGYTRLCSKLIRQKAIAIARERNIQGFIGTPSWCLRFLKRKKLLFPHGRGRKTVVTRGNIAQLPPDNNNNDMAEYDLSSMLSTGKQISKTSQPQPVMTETTLEPREVLPNMESELPEEIDFESSQTETINTIKEEFQDDQSDSDVPMMINESQLSNVTQQADSIIMDAYEPSSKRFLVIPEYQNRMMLSLASMWKQQKMCDASIGNGTTIIKVHKVVLLATSPTLLSNSEVRDDCYLRVNFPANISENAMRAFAEYMYNGILDLDPLTLTQLQQISYQLGIEELCLLCNTHLYSQTQDAKNIIQPGTSLSYLATQSDTSSSQISLNHKQSSSPGVKNNSLVQRSKGPNFILPDPVAVKIESQNSIQGSMGPAFPTHSEITTNVAVSVNEPVYSPGSTYVAKVSQIPKTFQERSQTLESSVVSQIKREHFNQNVFEYDQHRSTLSSESSTCTRLSTRSDCIHATTNSSHPPRLFSGPSPAIDTTSNQQTFSKNQLKAVTTLSTLPSSSEDKVARPTHENASLRTITENNDLRLNLKNRPSQLQNPYSTMLLSSELDTLHQNISQTAKREPYIDLTS